VKQKINDSIGDTNHYGRNVTALEDQQILRLFNDTVSKAEVSIQ